MWFTSIESVRSFMSGFSSRCKSVVQRILKSPPFIVPSALYFARKTESSVSFKILTSVPTNGISIEERKRFFANTPDVIS